MAWSRQETRAAILDYLWRSGGCFRPELIAHIGLTDASVSRIVNELRDEGIVAETRRRAPYRGGPSLFLGLAAQPRVGAIELSNGAVHMGIGTLAGETFFARSQPLPDTAEAEEVEEVLGSAVAALAEQGAPLAQIAVSIPGFHPDRSGNPIIACDARRARDLVAASFPDVPVTIANSIVTRTLAHELNGAAARDGGDYFYVFIGHGVGAAFVERRSQGLSVAICELGHSIVLRGGAPCRCGHAGCLEAYVSTRAVADALAIPEDDLLGPGAAAFLNGQRDRERDLTSRLTDLGVAIGNALNLRRSKQVVVAGWPQHLGATAHRALSDGIAQSLFGGAGDITLRFSPMRLGQEPQSGLALARFAFIQSGAKPMAPASARRSATATGSITTTGGRS